MSTCSSIIKNLLVTIPLNPPSLLEDLKSQFETVHYFPLPPFRPVRDPSHLPTEEHYNKADAMIAFTIPANLKDYKQTPRLKFVQVYSAGHSHIENTDWFKSIPTDSDVALSNASGIHVSTIGEHVLSTTILLFHKVHELIIRMNREKKWVDFQTEYGLPIRELRGMTVGIMGYGHIGRECSRLFSACGSKIIALNRQGKASVDEGYIIPGTGDKNGTVPLSYYTTESTESIWDFLGMCDVVVNTLPDSATTRGFVGKNELKAMKGNAIFVNIGRGTTVDQDALVEALKAQLGEDEKVDARGTLRIGGASLDVTNPEPLPEGHALFDLKNVILTPHMSGNSSSYFITATDLFKKNVERIEQSQKPMNIFRVTASK